MSANFVLQWQILLFSMAAKGYRQWLQWIIKDKYCWKELPAFGRLCYLYSSGRKCALNCWILNAKQFKKISASLLHLQRLCFTKSRPAPFMTEGLQDHEDKMASSKLAVFSISWKHHLLSCFICNNFSSTLTYKKRARCLSHSIPTEKLLLHPMGSVWSLSTSPWETRRFFDGRVAGAVSIQVKAFTVASQPMDATRAWAERHRMQVVGSNQGCHKCTSALHWEWYQDGN